MVDAYIKIEEDRLLYHRLHQKDFRVETRQGIADFFRQHQTAPAAAPASSSPHAQLGKHVILGASFLGGPRSQQQQFYDGLSIARTYGNPDLFITMTCNPEWPEIRDNLRPGETWHDRPDLVTRVFRLKQKQLLEDVTKHHVFGRCIGYTYSIEFQKRGLPHMHLLVILATEDKPRTSDVIDRIISAEIPDRQMQPGLYESIKKFMIHGPCGDHNPSLPCMVDGKCKDHFPYNLHQHTLIPENGTYADYRRRDDGRTCEVPRRRAGGGHHHEMFQANNGWVVPYNPYLIAKYDCHINVQVATSVEAFKYIFKYIFKGNDEASVAFAEDGHPERQHDEIRNFVNSRYITAPEAMWRIFEFPLHGKSHTVLRMSIHLEGEERVFFQEGNTCNGPANPSDHEEPYPGTDDSDEEDPTEDPQGPGIELDNEAAEDDGDEGDGDAGPSERAADSIHRNALQRGPYNFHAEKDMLGAFFRLCAGDSHARTFTYPEIVRDYRWVPAADTRPFRAPAP